jgi:hypothetical protein
MSSNKQQESQTQLTRYNAQLPTNSMQEIAVAGDLLARSGMFGVKNAAAGFVVVATCHQQGISLMEFHRTYHIVEGRPSMRADAMLAEFRKAGGRYKIVENSQTRAAAEVTFEGQKLMFEYTIEDAMRTGDCLRGDGKVKEIWTKRPEDMLWARLVSRFVRRLCPEINAGVYTPEEVRDFDDTPHHATAAAPISADEAARRAKVVTPEFVAPAQTTAAEGVDITDPSVCPIGGEGYAGRAWDEFENDELTAALESENPAMTIEHRKAIWLVVKQREEKQGDQ